MSSETREDQRPHYVNELPEGYPEDTPRCRHIFEREAPRSDVQGRMCGLPALQRDRCACHAGAPATDSDELRERLEKFVARDAYLGEAVLNGADLQSADLRGARLPWADLRLAGLELADLAGADLWASHLEGARMEGAALRDADLGHAHVGVVEVEDPGRDGSRPALNLREPTTMRNVDLRGASLAGIQLAPEADLSGALFDAPMLADERAMRDERYWRSTLTRRVRHRDRPPDAEECEALYRQLKLNYQESGEYTTAGDFFVREMECKRARLQEADRYQWLKQTIFYWLSGYGERPTRVMRWMTVIIVLFAWVQGALGLYDGETPVVGPGIDWLPSWAGVNSFVTALYFSMVTFTSLGYGDVRPAPWWLPRVLAGLEAMVGLALMALLMVCVVRKFSR